jgi:hypothetical protein
MAAGGPVDLLALGRPQEPVPTLDDAAAQGLGPLLQLTGGAPLLEGELEAVDGRLVEALGPQQVALLDARIAPADPGRIEVGRAPGLELHRQDELRPFVPAAILLLDVAGEILLAQPLLDDDDRPGLGIVEAGRHRAVPPLLVRDLGDGVGQRLVGLVGIIDDDDLAALAGDTRTDRGDQPLAVNAVSEAGFLVLLLDDFVALAPQPAVPRRLDEPAALHAVANRQVVAVARVQERDLWPRGGRFVPLRPYPGGKSHTAE